MIVYYSEKNPKIYEINCLFQIMLRFLISDDNPLFFFLLFILNKFNFGIEEGLKDDGQLAARVLFLSGPCYIFKLYFIRF